MYLKWIKLANSIRVGTKEENFLDGKIYHLYLDIKTNIIYVMSRLDKEAHSITSMANVIYTDTASDAFPFELFQEVVPHPSVKKAYERAKSSKSAPAN